MDILKISEDYAKNLLKDKLSSVYTYHNLDHTIQVVDKIKILAKEENINPEDTENLLLAGWFHDLGYVDDAENHEEESRKIASDFLRQHQFSEERIAKIGELILATDKFYKPKNHLEEVIKDADLYHLASDDYFRICENLRQEIKEVHHQKFSKQQWSELNIVFFSKHQFYTKYAKENWQPIKEKNVDRILSSIKDLKEEKKKKASEDNDKALLNKKKLEKLESPERGIETMFRVTLNNHTKLSQIADSKANILLSVNAIIISVALSTLIPKLDAPSNSHLIVPTFIMIMSSVACIILAIMSTRPKVSSGTFTRKEIEEKKVNLLFFGNFYKMPMEEYLWAMKEMMADRQYLYDTMIKDLYYLGIVLNRKYKLLRLTYTVFTIGIIASVIAFVIAFRSVTI
ncbi:Pycsar system effector family protein [Epilithonimonas hungarica]|uniref:Predicted metal-dependent phosphohydrolase, HD superfamily n=1 Tax=Epilithonimonas hungarica TaxID=454006 RepID=A0A1G7J8W6_9FLAO|nr:Pycsar system effector family protein [Epilithonimonas hungarica]MDP9956203.1 putative metal-dependent HD superfamily phosphohydrolase [Epilithonimonas hungarica]MPT31893.1 HD domain-containing protein [Chryseobacterium sp.]SDF21316.1 Predicted metal-dependent phosphohydrolase, HD superfamily [Epilithonimonas hungarica]